MEKFKKESFEFAKQFHLSQAGLLSLAVVWFGCGAAGLLFAMSKWLVLLVGLLGSIYLVLPKWQVAFQTSLLVLVLGCCYAFTTPILDAPAETMHLARALHVASGELMLSENATEDTISADYLRYTDPELAYHKTFSNNQLDQFQPTSEKIPNPVLRATRRFSGLAYLPQAFGLAVGKICGLNLMWTFYLGRLCNLFLYAGFCFLAIRRAHKRQTLMAFLTCFPMAVYLAASYSQFSFSLGLGFYIIAQFFTMLDQTESITSPQLRWYFVCCLLLVTTKVPYALLVALPLFIDRKKYANRKTFGFMAGMPVGVFLFGLLWFALTDGLTLAENTQSQLQAILARPLATLVLSAQSLLTQLNDLWQTIFSFGELSYGSPQAALLYAFVLGAIVFLYPLPVADTRFNKLGMFGVALGIFAAICFKSINWLDSGGLIVTGLQGSYFIILLPLLPYCFNLFPYFSPTDATITENQTKAENTQRLCLALALVFLIWMLFSTLARYGF